MQLTKFGSMYPYMIYFEMHRDLMILKSYRYGFFIPWAKSNISYLAVKILMGVNLLRVLIFHPRQRID
jgi:hypothetical protein